MTPINKISTPELKTITRQFLETAPDIYMPGVSVDTVIFGFHDAKLKVLLSYVGDPPYYGLPGGFVGKDEDLDDAALRILQERTGFENIYLDQFYTSGKKDRSNEKILKDLIEKVIGKGAEINWFRQRFVSICYYALIDDTKVKPSSEVIFGEFKWCDINKIPKLIFDHSLIIKKALATLRSDLDNKLVGSNLMSETFTMNELQRLYEAVYQQKLVRTNFQRKMLSLGVLERLEKQYNGKSHKAPYLYRFIRKKRILRHTL
ncbi:MAG TPA: NUDIX domain-containing protein [Chitinophagaceae bacterium]|nr:NUDIX domain-containing protein [Chitinophagaceae bacterium]